MSTDTSGAKMKIPTVMRLSADAAVLSKESDKTKQAKLPKAYRDLGFWDDPPLMFTIAIAVLLSVIAEYYAAVGSYALLVSVVLCLLLHIRATPHDNVPSADGWMPFFGHLLWVNSRFHRWYHVEVEQFMKYNRKSFATALLGNRRFIWTSNEKLIDIAFHERFSETFREFPSFDIVFGSGIFLANGNNWKRQRAIASRIFTLRSLKDFMYDVFERTAVRMVDKLEDLNKMPEYQKNGINMCDMFHRLTLDAFTEVAFGEKFQCIEAAPDIVPFQVSFDKLVELCAARMINPQWIWKLKRVFQVGSEKEVSYHAKVLDDRIESIYKRKRKFFKENMAAGGQSKKTKQGLSERYDLLSLYLADKPDSTLKELRDIAMNFIIAGRDTTAQNMSWMFYLLAQNPNVVTEIRKEIDANVPNVEDLDYQTVMKCKYLENALLETLRLYPSVPHVPRVLKCDMEFEENGKRYMARKNDVVNCAQWAMGRLPWVWDNPDKFDPTRFENTNYHPSKFPAFNIPPRVCLGRHVALLEMKIAIILLFKKFEFEFVPNQEITYVFSATNQMKNGIKFFLKPINSN